MKRSSGFRVGVVLGAFLVVAASAIVVQRLVSVRTEVGVWEEQCDRKIGCACSAAGFAYLVGQGVPRDASRALVHFRAACALDDLEGCASAGELLRDGAGTKRDASAAEGLFQKGCDGGVLRSCSLLGRLYLIPRGPLFDVARGQLLLKEDCDRGVKEDCVELAWRLSAPHADLPQDLPQAARLYQRACELDDVLGCRRWAQALACARGVTRNLKEASRRLAELCSQSDTPSCLQLAALVADPEAPRFPDDLVGLPQVRRIAAIDAAADGRGPRAGELVRELEREGADGGHGEFSEFMRGAFDLDADRVDDAVARSAKLEGGHPADPTLEVFKRLAAHRGKPGMGWALALRSAWIEAGRPDLRSSAFLPPFSPYDFGSCGRFAPRPAQGSVISTDGFVLAAADHLGGAASDPREPPSEALLRAAMLRASEPDVPVQLIALALLRDKSLSAEQKRRARPVAKHAWGTLAAEHPGDLFVALGAGVDAVPTLEALRAAPFAPPKREVFELFRRAHQAGHRENPAQMAFMGMVNVLILESPELFPGLESGPEATRDPQRVGELLMSLGARMSEGGWIVEIFQGASLQRRGAALTQRPEDVARASETGQRATRFYANGSVQPFLGAWPLHHLQEDLAEAGLDEVSFHEGALPPKSPAPDSGP